MSKNPQTYGNLSSRTTEDVRFYTASASQTTFSVNYSVGYVTVYQNGRRLRNDVDFTATNGTTIVLVTGATLGDDLVCIGKVSFTIPNAITTTAGGVTAGQLKTSSPTAGLGYATGAGGSVTQTTSKATTVVLNNLSGRITTHGAILNSATAVSFTLTNSTIAATDVVLVTIASGPVTNGSYVVQADTCAAGSCIISIRNVTAGNLTETLVLNFVVIKAVIT